MAEVAVEAEGQTAGRWKGREGYLLQSRKRKREEERRGLGNTTAHLTKPNIRAEK